MCYIKFFPGTSDSLLSNKKGAVPKLVYSRGHALFDAIKESSQ